MTWVKAVWVLKSLLETNINVDYIRLLKKKEPTIWPDQEAEFPADIQKLINALIWTATANKHPFEPPPIGLVIHSKVAAVRRKVPLPLRQGGVCLKWIWVFLPG